MPPRYLPADPAVAASLAIHDEQIRTLQRERREDRDEARAAIEELKAEIRGDLGGLKSTMTDGLNAVRADLAAQIAPIRGEIAPITDMRKRGLAFLLGACLAGMAMGYKFLEPVLKWAGLR